LLPLGAAKIPLKGNNFFAIFQGLTFKGYKNGQSMIVLFIDC
jgi:hypothetical protein